MSLNYFPLYVAKVTEIVSGRTIKAENEFMPAEMGEIVPLLDGLVKLPPPVVDQFVLVLQADASNLYRWYIPIRSDFASLTDNADSLQIESAGNLDLEGDTIYIGVDASESAVLGDTLKTQLEDLIIQITAITVTGNLGVPTSPPINAAAISALSALLVNILSGKIVVE